MIETKPAGNRGFQGRRGPFGIWPQPTLRWLAGRMGRSVSPRVPTFLPLDGLVTGFLRSVEKEKFCWATSANKSEIIFRLFCSTGEPGWNVRL